MDIAIIDGQGGGVGRALVTAIRKEWGDSVHLLALGTNATATAAMLRAGADEGATGENPILFNAGKVDIILGPIGIILANALLGELTPRIACAVAESPAQKILVPVNRCHVIIAGLTPPPLPEAIDQAMACLRQMIAALDK
ncbi:DUF3842 family protein [Christensenellaceae bacterium NSJ-44]|uniref:DUF3842 family protein n=1 Tax=Luoshenia tenuis TaxID=2763654 RepID=A0A926D0F3_9FIRM|nr:DUF3842 family protein [Luoshenia tenuis]MBC8530080.1 DUF3842 family protein [Luoshenia tenuis]